MISSSQFISGSNPTLQFRANPNRIIPFNTHFTKTSRVLIKIPSGVGIEARYTAEPAETAQTLYQLLGIAETGSTFSDIKKAYRRMARKHHPDVSSPDQVDENTRRFILVHQAYETLSNPQTRASYDRALLTKNSDHLSARKSRLEMEENTEWKIRWKTQLEKLNRRELNRERDATWGARMRARWSGDSSAR